MILPEPMIIESNGYPPEFVQLFTDRKITVGGNATFEARVTGSQPLNVNLPVRFSNLYASSSFRGLLVI